MKYLINNKRKTIFNGIIPRYEDLRIYSTNEVIIGKWIDGKNLYRKVYTGSLTITTMSASARLIQLPTDINELVDYYGTFAWGEYKETFPIPWEGKNLCELRQVQNTLHYFGHAAVGTGVFKIVIEYTKTID